MSIFAVIIYQAVMNNIITIIIYVFICSAALAQPSGFDHPSRYWRYSYCYYADFQSEGIPDTGADIEVYNLGEVERKGTTYQMALRVRGHLYHIPSMVDTLLYRWEGKRAYADFDDMCRVLYDGDGDALRRDYPCVGGEVVLYDFTLGVGDSFGGTKVRDVSKVSLGGETRKLLTLETGHCLLEGIGSTSGGFFEYMKVPLWLPGFKGICSTYLRIYEEDGLPMFQQSSEETYEFLMREEDVHEFFLMNVREGLFIEPKDNPIHDLQGRRLNGIPQKGVYIQNSRKYVK